MKDVNPKLSNGFTRIANELYDAIMIANFTKTERKIIDAVIRKTYGYNRKNDVISIRQIAQITNVRFQHISRSLQQLIAEKVIIATGNHQKRILKLNKNYTNWGRFSVTETVTKCNENGDTKVNSSVTENVTECNESCYGSVTESVTETSQVSAQQKTKDNIKDSSKDKDLKNARKSIKKKVTKIDYPQWLDVPLFKAYIKNRVFMHSPMSDHAQNLAIAKLERLISAGGNQTEMIEAAIEKNWKSFYKPNYDKGNSNGTKPNTNKTTRQRYASDLDQIAQTDIEENGFTNPLDNGDIQKI